MGHTNGPSGIAGKQAVALLARWTAPTPETTAVRLAGGGLASLKAARRAQAEQGSTRASSNSARLPRRGRPRYGGD